MKKPDPKIKWSERILDCISNLNSLNTKLVKVIDELGNIKLEADKVENTSTIKGQLETISKTSLLEAYNANRRSIKSLEILQKKLI